MKLQLFEQQWLFALQAPPVGLQKHELVSVLQAPEQQSSAVPVEHGVPGGLQQRASVVLPSGGAHARSPQHRLPLLGLHESFSLRQRFFFFFFFRRLFAAARSSLARARSEPAMPPTAAPTLRRVHESNPEPSTVTSLCDDDWHEERFTHEIPEIPASGNCDHT